MSQTVKEVMTPDPIALPATASVFEAARAMRDSDVGPVIVLDGETIRGIVTDRDITVRAVADEMDLATVTIGDICSEGVASVGPDDPVEQAVGLMQERAVRRIPVVEDGRPIGIVSLGDVAMTTSVDLDETIEDISAAPPNN